MILAPKRPAIALDALVPAPSDALAHGETAAPAFIPVLATRLDVTSDLIARIALASAQHIVASAHPEPFCLANGAAL